MKNNSKLTGNQANKDKKKEERKTVKKDSDKQGVDKKLPLGLMMKKGKIFPELDNDSISMISKNNVSSTNNCETNILINENLNQLAKKSSISSARTSAIKDEQKELENMKSFLVQYHYINALLEDTYSKQRKCANVSL